MRPIVIGALLLCGSVLPANCEEQTMEFSPDWEFVSDRVMGGVSEGRVSFTERDGRRIATLTGAVSLENNGGFVQMAFDPDQRGGTFDGSAWTGIEIEVRGNGETYEVRLRTSQLTRPWQSYRTSFRADDQWQTLRFPFAKFTLHRTDQPFDPAKLRRIGILAIGRAFEAEVSVACVRLYR